MWRGVGGMKRYSEMNAAEILSAVRQAGAGLRVEGESLVASNASRIAPAIKAAIREHKSEVISALLADGTACKVTIIELPQAQRYRKVFGVLQLKPPALVPVERWRQCVEDVKRFLAAWGSQAEALGYGCGRGSASCPRAARDRGAGRAGDPSGGTGDPSA